MTKNVLGRASSVSFESPGQQVIVSGHVTYENAQENELSTLAYLDFVIAVKIRDFMDTSFMMGCLGANEAQMVRQPPSATGA